MRRRALLLFRWRPSYFGRRDLFTLTFFSPRAFGALRSQLGFRVVAVFAFIGGVERRTVVVVVFIALGERDPQACVGPSDADLSQRIFGGDPPSALAGVDGVDRR